jgi:mevalonate kinase
VETKPNQFVSNGKLLLTGEYLILFGSRALAFPVKYGQTMVVEETDLNPILSWRAYEPDGLWFSADFSLPDLSIKDTSRMEQALYLQKLLKQIEKIKPGFFSGYKGLAITTTANFPVKWGFGTSSTLINNLAEWAKIDTFEFFYSVSKGSGYDLACAAIDKPILFQRDSSGKPIIRQIAFNKSYLSNMYLVYSGRKKTTEQHISQFLQRHRGLKEEIKRISHITDRILENDSLEEFIDLLKEHERITGAVLDEPPVQFEKFVSFNGVIKSLGAWGGDFLLTVSTENFNYITNYFEQFGLSTILPFSNTVLK